MIWIFLAVLIPSLTTLVGTECVRRYALRTSMIDVPNDRSSHTVPTPRGGGIAISTSVLASLLVLTVAFPSQRSSAMGILGGGLLVALIGMLDDRFNLSIKVRLAAQFTAACWLVIWIGGVGSTQFLGFNVSVLLALAAVVFIVWCTNLYNFMDGLDGFAGGQALVAATAAALICFRQQDSLLAYAMFATAGAAAGFLVWNWPPAKIFMGDCGSGFLGFLFGCVVVVGYRHGTMPLSAGLTLIIIFLSDATLTLLNRIRNGEVWYKPHRMHAYQLATQLGASHKQVTSAAIAGFVAAAVLAVYMTQRRDWAPLLLTGYATVLVGIWFLINRLFVGRRRSWASITTARPVVDHGNEAAAVSYPRLRSFQLRLKTWRLDMPRNDLLTEATGVASDLGYTVSHDWLEGCGGGRCEAAGEKWILLDFNMSKQDQVRQILLAIHEEADNLESMSIDLRSALDKATTAAGSGVKSKAA